MAVSLGRAWCSMWAVSFDVTWFCLFVFAYTFPLPPYKYCENRYSVNECMVDNLTVVSLHCVSLLFFYTAKDRWGKLDLCRAGADQTAPCSQGSPQQHRVRADPLWGEPAVVTPLAVTCSLLFMTLRNRGPIFVFSHVPSVWWGAPSHGSLMSSKRYALRRKEGPQPWAMSPQTRGPWPDPEMQGLCFQEHLLSQPLSLSSLLFLSLNLLNNKLNLKFNLPPLTVSKTSSTQFKATGNACRGHRERWDIWTHWFSEAQMCAGTPGAQQAPGCDGKQPLMMASIV